MYAPPGVDTDSSGEETTPPPTPKTTPVRGHFSFKSLFTPTRKLSSKPDKPTTEEVKTSTPVEAVEKDATLSKKLSRKKSVRIFAGELMKGQEGRKAEGLTTTRGERVEPEVDPVVEVIPEPEVQKEKAIADKPPDPVANEVLVLLRKLVADNNAAEITHVDLPPVLPPSSTLSSDSARTDTVEEFPVPKASRTDGKDKGDSKKKGEELVVQPPVRPEPLLKPAEKSHSTGKLQGPPSALPPSEPLLQQPPGSSQHNLAQSYYASFASPQAPHLPYLPTNIDHGGPTSAPPYGYHPFYPPHPAYYHSPPWCPWYPPPPQPPHQAYPTYPGEPGQGGDQVPPSAPVGSISWPWGMHGSWSLPPPGQAAQASREATAGEPPRSAPVERTSRSRTEALDMQKGMDPEPSSDSEREAAKDRFRSIKSGKSARAVEKSAKEPQHGDQASPGESQTASQERNVKKNEGLLEETGLPTPPIVSKLKPKDQDPPTTPTRHQKSKEDLVPLPPTEELQATISRYKARYAQAAEKLEKGGLDEKDAKEVKMEMKRLQENIMATKISLAAAQSESSKETGTSLKSMQHPVSTPPIFKAPESSSTPAPSPDTSANEMVAKYQARLDDAIKAYRQPNLSDEERKLLKEKVRAAEAKLKASQREVGSERAKTKPEGGALPADEGKKERKGNLSADEGHKERKEKQKVDPPAASVESSQTPNGIVGKMMPNAAVSAPVSDCKSTSELEAAIAKYKVRNGDAIEAYKQDGISESEKKERSKNVKTYERKLEEAMQGLNALRAKADSKGQTSGKESPSSERDDLKKREIKRDGSPQPQLPSKQIISTGNEPVALSRSRYSPEPEAASPKAVPSPDDASLKDRIVKYEARYNQALKAYKQDGLRDGEKMEKKKMVRQAEEALVSLKKEVKQSSGSRRAEDAERAPGVKADEHGGSPRKERRTGPGEGTSPLSPSDMKLVAQQPDTPPTPIIPSHPNRNIQALKDIVSTYKTRHSEALKRYKQSGISEVEKRERRDAMQRAEGNLREAMEALESATAEDKVETSSKVKNETCATAQKGKGKARDYSPKDPPRPKEKATPGPSSQPLSPSGPSEADPGSIAAKYKARYAAALKAYKLPNLGDEDRSKRIEDVRRVEGKLKEAMQALETAQKAKRDGEERENTPLTASSSTGTALLKAEGEGQVADARSRSLPGGADQPSILEKTAKPQASKRVTPKDQQQHTETPAVVQDTEKIIAHYKSKYATLTKEIQKYDLTMAERQAKGKDAEKIKMKIKALLEKKDVATLYKAEGPTISKPKRDVETDSADGHGPQDGGQSTKPDEPPRSAAKERHDEHFNDETQLKRAQAKHAAYVKAAQGSGLTEEELHRRKMELAKQAEVVKSLMGQIKDKSAGQASLGDKGDKRDKNGAEQSGKDGDVVTHKALLEEAKAKYAAYSKASKEPDLTEEEVKRRQVKVAKQAEALKSLMAKTKDDAPARDSPKKVSGKDDKRMRGEGGSAAPVKKEGGVSPEEYEKAIAKAAEERGEVPLAPASETKNVDVRRPQQAQPSRGIQVEEETAPEQVTAWAPLNVSKRSEAAPSKERPRSELVRRAPTTVRQVGQLSTEAGTGFVSWSKTLVSLASCIDLARTILTSITVSSPGSNPNPLSQIISRLITGLILQRDLVESVRGVIGDEHDERLNEFMAHMSVVRMHLEEVMAGKADGDDLMDREIGRTNQSLEAASIQTVLSYVMGLTEFLTPGMMAVMRGVFDEWRIEGFSVKTLVHTVLAIRRELAAIHDAKEKEKEVEGKERAKGLMGVLDRILALISPERHDAVVSASQQTCHGNDDGYQPLSKDDSLASNSEMTSDKGWGAQEAVANPRHKDGHSRSATADKDHHKLSDLFHISSSRADRSPPPSATAPSSHHPNPNPISKSKPSRPQPIMEAPNEKLTHHDLSHSPLHLPQATQNLLDGSSSWHRGPAQPNTVLENDSGASMSRKQSRPPPVVVRHDSTESDISPSRVITFPALSRSPTDTGSVTPTRRPSHTRERDQESSPSRYSQTSAASTSSTVKSDNLARQLLAQADSGPRPFRHDWRNDIEEKPDEGKEEPGEDEVKRAEEVLYDQVLGPGTPVRPVRSERRRLVKVVEDL